MDDHPLYDCRVFDLLDKCARRFQNVSPKSITRLTLKGLVKELAELERDLASFAGRLCASPAFPDRIPVPKEEPSSCAALAAHRSLVVQTAFAAKHRPRPGLPQRNSPGPIKRKRI